MGLGLGMGLGLELGVGVGLEVRRAFMRNAWPACVGLRVWNA